jgi:hypothetical protein
MTALATPENYTTLTDATYADRPNAAKRLSLYIVVRVLESEAFAIPESQPDAIAEGLEKVVLAVASWIGNAKALDLVKQVIS